MLSYCKSIRTTRRKFSDFEFYDAANADDLDSVYLAGYIEKPDGTRENIRIRASAVVNTSVGTVVPSLEPGVDHPSITIKDEKIGGTSSKVVVINNTDATFIQINKISPSLLTKIEDKNYLVIRFSNDTPWGKVTKVYLPNFPLETGVRLLPLPALSASEQGSKEVFFNRSFISPAPENYDFYTTFIQLADPQRSGGEQIVNMTKVVECFNITNDYAEV